jgi:hypothetical protein
MGRGLTHAWKEIVIRSEWQRTGGHVMVLLSPNRVVAVVSEYTAGDFWKGTAGDRKVTQQSNIFMKRPNNPASSVGRVAGIGAIRQTLYISTSILRY